MRRKGSEEADNFEEWVTRQFGNRLYEHFFRTYSEKLWGIPCHHLDKEFAVQRIKDLNLWEAVKDAFSNGQSKHKTLVDRFAYPLYGTGMIYERMKAFIEKQGNNVHCHVPINKLLANEDKVIQGLELKDGQSRAYDVVVSSMPITKLVKSLPDAPEQVIEATNQLKFRNTILVYLEVDHPALFPDNWLYIHSPHLKVGRITNFRNWSPELYRGARTTILALEYWCFFEDNFWGKAEAELISLASAELYKTGLIGENRIISGHVYHIPRCYPVYEKGYKKHLDVVKSWLDQFSGLQAIGRYGAFNYTNQDHSMLMGLRAAENLTSQTAHNLWKVNSGEVYQEDNIVDE
jgi:protoporphyrinogen oxidase